MNLYFHSTCNILQIAFLLVYGQSVVWRVAEFGYREFGDLANNTARLISELFSDFITSQGGWVTIKLKKKSFFDLIKMKTRD